MRGLSLRGAVLQGDTHLASQSAGVHEHEGEATGLAAVLSALCSSNRPMEKAVVCFLTLRSQHKAIAKRNGKLSREVSVFQLPMYFVLLRLAQVR